MKRLILISAIATTLLGASSAFAGGPNQAPISAPIENSDAIDAASLARAQAKLAHASQIANQFAASASAEGLNERWRVEMINSLMSKPERTFAEVQAKANVRDAMAVAVAPASTAAGTAKDLGDTTDDLTYIPLPAPCRIVDTRTSSGGSGQLLAGTPRSFSFTSANSSQGGSGCTPFTGYVGGGQPGAAAVNITVIGGGAAVAGSFLQAYPFGGSTSTSWLNFGAGQIIANEGILGIASSQFTIRTNAAADAIVDVFGSFVRNHATALDCVAVGASGSGASGRSSVVIPANSNDFYSTDSCPAGYTVTAPNCYSGNLAGVYQNGAGISGGGAGLAGVAFCGYINLNGTQQTVFVGASCCRIPGRTN